LLGAGGRFCADSIEFLAAGLRQSRNLIREGIELALFRLSHVLHRFRDHLGNGVERRDHFLAELFGLGRRFLPDCVQPLAAGLGERVELSGKSLKLGFLDLAQLAHGAGDGFGKGLEGVDHFLPELFCAGCGLLPDGVEALAAGLGKGIEVAREDVELALLRGRRVGHAGDDGVAEGLEGIGQLLALLFGGLAQLFPAAGRFFPYGLFRALFRVPDHIEACDQAGGIRLGDLAEDHQQDHDSDDKQAGDGN